MLNLGPTARPMVFCEVGSGFTASFWMDNWTDRGPHIDLIGDQGPSITRIPIDAVVADAIIGGEWWLSRSRSRSPTLRMLRECLPEVTPIVDSEVDDQFLWRARAGEIPGAFSTAKTWSALHPPGDAVFWHSQVWFSGRMPKHAFITWVAAWNRLSTRDRMVGWGMSVSPSCLLCNAVNESRDHLFFRCPISQQVWSFFYNNLQFSPPGDFEDCLRWLKNPARERNVVLIVRLIF